MGRIIDLIKNFIEPKKQQTFEEIAIDAGVNQSELKQLKSTMEGISWSKFAREDVGEKKEGKTSKVRAKGGIKIDKNQQEKRNTSREESGKDLELE